MTADVCYMSREKPNLRDCRVVFFLPNLAGGGAERVIVTLATELPSRGIGVDLIVADAHGPFLPLVSGQVNLVNLASKGVLRAIPKLARHLRLTRPPVLITTLHHASLAAIVAQRLSRVGTQVIIREASTPSARTRSLRRPKGFVTSVLMQRAFRLADHVIAVSAGAARDLETYAGLPRNRVTVLHNPVVSPDLERLQEITNEHPWFASTGVPVILGVGRLHPDKDFATLMRAFARVRQRRPARLVILGEGPERGRLEQLAEELEIGQDTSLAGFVDNPFSFMARASVYVLSSRREGLPGTLIQAMACGCPVVATDCPSGPSEVVEDGRYGELVPVGDDGAMARAIERSLDHRPEPDVLKEAAARYSSDAAMDRYVTFLRERL